MTMMIHPALDSRVFANVSLQDLAAGGLRALARKLNARRLPTVVAVNNERWTQREDRFSLGLPVELNRATGTTRDVSKSGMFFETDAGYRFARTIDLNLELETPAGALLLTFRGDIVRIEPRDNRVGVAISILRSSVEPAWW